MPSLSCSPYRESARLAQLVDQVLWASRLDSGRADTVIERLDATELAKDVAVAQRAHLPPGLSLELSSEARPATSRPTARSSSTCSSTSSRTPSSTRRTGARIEVRLEPADGHLRVTVQDEGLGIPAAEQAAIFDKFKRLDPNLTRGVGGTGLGVYICRELVQQMGGRIWVVSEPAKGSAFSFELPWASRPQGRLEADR